MLCKTCLGMGWGKDLDKDCVVCLGRGYGGGIPILEIAYRDFKLLPILELSSLTKLQNLYLFFLKELVEWTHHLKRIGLYILLKGMVDLVKVLEKQQKTVEKWIGAVECECLT